MKVASLRPAPGYLTVEPDPVPTNVGQIVLPEQNSLRPQSGRVVRAGAGLEVDYPPGTRVVFGEHAGSGFTVEEGQYRIITDMEVICTIDEAAE